MSRSIRFVGAEARDGEEARLAGRQRRRRPLRGALERLHVDAATHDFDGRREPMACDVGRRLLGHGERARARQAQDQAWLSALLGEPVQHRHEAAARRRGPGCERGRDRLCEHDVGREVADHASQRRHPLAQRTGREQTVGDPYRTDVALAQKLVPARVIAERDRHLVAAGAEALGVLQRQALRSTQPERRRDDQHTHLVSR